MRIVRYGLILALGWFLGAFISESALLRSQTLQPVISPDIALERVRLTPAGFQVDEHSCTGGPATRQMQINLAVSQWARFGFLMLRQQTDDGVFEEIRSAELWDEDVPEILRALRNSHQRVRERDEQGFGAIAAYWSVIDPAPGAGGSPQVDSRLGRARNDPRAVAETPWSGAFISWIMCESGLDTEAFPRKSAHWRVIEALSQETASPAFTEDLDVGGAEPGDIVCYCRNCVRYSPGPQPMHCDLVVERTQSMLLVIGGNVRDSVALQLIPIEHLSINPERYVRLRSLLPNGAHLSDAFLSTD